MSPEPTWIGNRLVELRECLCNALTDFGAGPVCWCGLYPGQQVAWEFCGECAGDHCGMGYVRLASAFPQDGNLSAILSGRCTTSLAYTLNVGALRCLPYGGADGEPPSEADMLAATLDQAADMMAIRKAIECCFGKADHAMGTWQPLGPSGGCVGGEWLVAVGA